MTRQIAFEPLPASVLFALVMDVAVTFSSPPMSHPRCWAP